jgi:hypothetical protein
MATDGKCSTEIFTKRIGLLAVGFPKSLFKKLDFVFRRLDRLLVTNVLVGLFGQRLPFLLQFGIAHRDADHLLLFMKFIRQVLQFKSAAHGMRASMRATAVSVLKCGKHGAGNYWNGPRGASLN